MSATEPAPRPERPRCGKMMVDYAGHGPDRQCRNAAQPGTDPPRCGKHPAKGTGRGKARVGAAFVRIPPATGPESTLSAPPAPAPTAPEPHRFPDYYLLPGQPMPARPPRPERLGLHHYRCPGCGGTYGRGKGPHGLARHACPPAEVLREQLVEVRAELAQEQETAAALKRTLDSARDQGLQWAAERDAARQELRSRLAELELQLATAAADLAAAQVPRRTPLPTERRSTTVRFRIGQEHGYLTVGEYPDGRPGEIFVVLAKHGDGIRGALDAWARAISLLLQCGYPLDDLVAKFRHQRFEPQGFTDVPGLEGFASSIPDLVVRWLERRYLGADGERSGQGAEPGDAGQGATDGGAA